MAIITPMDGLGEVIVQLGRLGLTLQALGIIIVLWIIFESIALIVNRKKRLAIYKIRDDLVRVEKKIDKLLTKRK